MVDDMDLLSGLKGAPSLPPQAFDEARDVLRAAMTVEEAVQETTVARRRRLRWSRRATMGVSAVAVGAAAVAVSLVVTSTPAPAPSHNATVAGKSSNHQPPANPILSQLAANITVKQVQLPGNATLEIRNQSPTSLAIGDNGIDLYTDDGTYYWANSKSLLPGVVAQQQDTAQGQFKRDIVAALYAVTGNIDTARAQMSVANLAPGATSRTVEPQALKAAIEKQQAYDKAHHIKYTPPKPLTPAQKAEQTDNLIWMNATDAMIAAPQNPQVRAGVLRLMATMPNVKVSQTVTAGRPTLTVSDSWPLLADPGLVESLVINASTGLPIAMFNRDPGQPLNATYYHSWRATLADVESGKF